MQISALFMLSVLVCSAWAGVITDDLATAEQFLGGYGGYGGLGYGGLGYGGLGGYGGYGGLGYGGYGHRHHGFGGFGHRGFGFGR